MDHLHAEKRTQRPSVETTYYPIFFHPYKEINQNAIMNITTEQHNPLMFLSPLFLNSTIFKNNQPLSFLLHYVSITIYPLRKNSAVPFIASLCRRLSFHQPSPRAPWNIPPCLSRVHKTKFQTKYRWTSNKTNDYRAAEIRQPSCPRQNHDTKPRRSPHHPRTRHPPRSSTAPKRRHNTTKARTTRRYTHPRLSNHIHQQRHPSLQWSRHRTHRPM